jgi:hypothetical protein
MPHKNTKT